MLIVMLYLKWLPKDVGNNWCGETGKVPWM